MKRFRLSACILAFLLAGGSIHSQTQTASPTPARPPIVGVAHIGLFTDNMDASRNFYGHILGYEEPFSLHNADGGLELTYFKVNDHQYIEIFPGLKAPDQDRLSHIAFETTNIRQLRDYLAAKGVTVPDTVKSGRDKNLNFMIQDPDGHNVEFVQYMPGSLHSNAFGKHLPDTRVSDHMIHVGILVQDQAAADRLYRDILGFHSVWHGGMKDDRTDWVDMRVPDGTDWLEYMLNQPNPSVRTRGVMHHLALGVSNVKEGAETVIARGYATKETPKIGRDGKWQFNLYDPNLTRVELMEPKPVETPCCSPISSH